MSLLSSKKFSENYIQLHQSLRLRDDRLRGTGDWQGKLGYPGWERTVPYQVFLVSHPLGTKNSEMTNKSLYVNCLHKDDTHPFFFQIQGFLFIHLFSRRYMCQSVCACVKIHVAVRGQPWAGVFLSCCPSYILRWGLLPNLKLTSSTRRAEQKAPATSPMLGLQSHVGDPDFMFVLKTPNQVLMLAWQALYWLNHYLVPIFLSCRHIPKKNVQNNSVTLKAKVLHLILLFSQC